jgi:hypothetical protein
MLDQVFLLCCGYAGSRALAMESRVPLVQDQEPLSMLLLSLMLATTDVGLVANFSAPLLASMSTPHHGSLVPKSFTLGASFFVVFFVVVVIDAAFVRCFIDSVTCGVCFSAFAVCSPTFVVCSHAFVIGSSTFAVLSPILAISSSAFAICYSGLAVFYLLVSSIWILVPLLRSPTLCCWILRSAL